MSDALRHTPLYEQHVKLGAKMVPFAGFEMPVQYPDGITAEHKAVRENVGIFDVSHMGEFEVSGVDARAWINRITCNDAGSLQPGEVQYSALLTDAGTFVDDCTVYRFEDKVMLVVNAANIARDWEHIVAQKGGANIRLKDISSEVGLLALQGPNAEPVLQKFTDIKLNALKYYHFATGKVAGKQCFLSRTGYTGEDGFEIYCRSSDTPVIWDALTVQGKVPPIGLGARDSLRLEVAYPLYGNDIDETTTAWEAGLGWIVKMDKGVTFTGLDGLKRQKLDGIKRKLVGFKLLEKGFPRHGYDVYYNGKKVDIVRSGTVSPSLGDGIGMTYLPADATEPGTKFEVDCRGTRVPAEVVKRPFWTKGSAKKK